ncbi:MAG: hypothetical protein ACLT1W_10355 [Alistipes onderdonkii]
MLGDDGSIDAWFAAPGGYFDGRNLKYDDTPHRMRSRRTHSAARALAESEPFYAVRACTPTRRLRRFAHAEPLRLQDDYATTVARKPVAVRRFENYKDNQTEVTRLRPLPGRGLSLGAGRRLERQRWCGAPKPVSGVTNYFDGEPVGG